MKSNSKPVEALTPLDLEDHAIWEYVNDDKLGETHVRPVEPLPVTSLSGRLVGIKVRLANGEALWAQIENVDCVNARLNEHFLTISIWRERAWFTLARYFDIDYHQSGPEGLAKFLDLGIDEVFPITYDLRPFAEGNVEALAGTIGKEPRERLSRAELISLAVP